MPPVKKSAALKALLLLCVLAIHFASRHYAGEKTSPSQTHFYPTTYSYSLSLLAGRGFAPLSVSEGPEGRPLREFLELNRLRLGRGELEGGLAEPSGEAQRNPLASFRVLDLYLAAGLWWIFGASWTVYFHFYFLVSTIVCLSVFCMGRRIGGGYGCGLIAALLYTASPIELQMTASSVRDISPLWFIAFGFFFLHCVAGRFEGRILQAVSYIVLGAASIIGIGWRDDVLLLPPFLLVALLIQNLAERRGISRAASAAFLFLAGAFATYFGVHSLTPQHGNYGGNASNWHIVAYAEHPRSNLLGYENSFQVARDDVLTADAVNFHRSIERSGALVTTYLSPPYADAARDFSAAVFRMNLFRWLAGFPRFFQSALGAFSEGDALQGQASERLRETRMPFLLPLFEWGGDFLLMCLSWLFWLGLLFGLFLLPSRVAVLTQALFAVYYAFFLLLVLPETKHAPPLVLPQCLLGAVGLSTIPRLLLPRRLAAALPPNALLFARRAGVSAASLFVAWGLAWGLARWVSVLERRAAVEGIRELAAVGAEVDASTVSKGIFTASLDPEAPDPPVGYVLRIRTGAAAAHLECRRLRALPTGWALRPTPLLDPSEMPRWAQIFSTPVLHTTFHRLLSRRGAALFGEPRRRRAHGGSPPLDRHDADRRGR